MPACNSDARRFRAQRSTCFSFATLRYCKRTHRKNSSKSSGAVFADTLKSSTDPLSKSSDSSLSTLVLESPSTHMGCSSARQMHMREDTKSQTLSSSTPPRPSALRTSRVMSDGHPSISLRFVEFAISVPKHLTTRRNVGACTTSSSVPWMWNEMYCLINSMMSSVVVSAMASVIMLTRSSMPRRSATFSKRTLSFTGTSNNGRLVE
mmetsp:Transcript_4400/g.12702  ORF Transcript_4400/g.12702 Transcript_4400/m.12702 type:complete len:207 (+) Transcript_4400:649-1269(+)